MTMTMTMTRDENDDSKLGSIHGRAAIAFAALAVGAVAAGCGGDLPVASVLERTRVIGARVEVPADPGRADVAPGEAAAVSWLVAGPSTPATLDWSFALCTGVGGFCHDQPQPVGTGTGTPVVVPFTTPDAAALGTDLSPTMIGAVCADGTVGLDPATNLPSCTGADASGTLTRFVIPLVPDGATPNHHPALGNDVIEFAGAVWDPATATTAEALAMTGAACDASTGLPVVTATPAGSDGVEQTIRIVSDADDRETFTPAGASAATLEELQISNFTTAGKFDSNYAAVFATDTRPDADATIKWTAPKAADVAAGGEVVSFHFVVRDLRGGLDMTTRALCVVAP